MKLLQFNITSLNTSSEKLWGYQKENNYDAKFLQETNYTGKFLAYFKHWNTRVFTNFQNKAMGIGVGALASSTQKNVFRDDLSRKDLEIIWINEMQTQGEKRLLDISTFHLEIKITSIFLDMELEKYKDENILQIGDFSSRNKIWDGNANNNSRMGLILEDIINRHGLYIATNTDFTYQQSIMVSNNGKSTIDLTLTRGLKNI